MEQPRRRIDGAPAPPGAAGRGPRPRRKPWWEVMHPEGAEGTFRDLPRLVADALRLAWSAGRRELLLTASLQLVSALGVAAQLFVGKALLEAVLRAGGEDQFTGVLPALAALVAVTVALDFAQAVEAEQSRVLGELGAAPSTACSTSRPASTSSRSRSPTSMTGSHGRARRACSARSSWSTDSSASSAARSRPSASSPP